MTLSPARNRAASADPPQSGAGIQRQGQAAAGDTLAKPEDRDAATLLRRLIEAPDHVQRLRRVEVEAADVGVSSVPPRLRAVVAAHVSGLTAPSRARLEAMPVDEFMALWAEAS